ncbi:MAG: glycoside hydrolase family 78 protein [Spirochaetia bacterium]|nr:glycoside hydrolase family 78 protein [Spirochaetia bacterium]
MLTATRLTCNYQTDPMGIDERVRFGWVIESDRQEILQRSYTLHIAEDPGFSTLVFDSGMIDSQESVHVYADGFEPESNSRYWVRVAIRDNRGESSPWSTAASFETAMLSSELWKAHFITGDREEDGSRSDAKALRSTFRISGAIASARAYATALGLYELHLNGSRVGDYLLTPGWSSYESRLLYQSYDITGMLVQGENAIGALVGAGWYKGTMGFMLKRNHYGNRAALLCQLEITYDDGSKEIIGSDGSWKCSESAITFSEIYDGEIYDARNEEPQWASPGFDDSAWEPVSLLPTDYSRLKAQDGEPIRRISSIPAQQLMITPEGDTVLDFGQNLTGWVRFSVSGKAGDRVELQHAEILDSDGNFYTENLRAAKAALSYTLRGDGLEVFEPHFTFYGFRYVRILSYPAEVRMEDFTAVVIHSDMAPTGSFSCSNPLLNRLQHNILWGMKGNFLDIPTDCPQRDERLGWTGDAQIFAGEACFLMNTDPFFRKWLRDLAADQTPEGGVPHVIPNIIHEQIPVEDILADPHSSSAWGDAAVIIPWTLYTSYGDRQILSEQYESMKGWVEYIRARAADGLIWDSGFHFGDWVALDAAEGSYFGATPTELVATAYYAHSTGLLAKSARVLGHEEDQKTYEQLHEAIKTAYQKQFLHPNGSLIPRTQTACILSLHFRLIETRSIEPVVQLLVDLIDQAGGHLNTGFVGTPYICQALSDNGRVAEAYDLLLKEDYPSWLYQVRQGATTIWEHWDGLRPDGTMWSSDMNSFNHYAYGAVGQWLYSVIGGIRTTDEGAGWREMIIRPEIGGGLSYAETSLETVYGLLSVRWDRTMARDQEQVTLQVRIPHNTTAQIILPGAAAILEDSGLQFSLKDSQALSAAGSGTYRITYERET